MYKWLWLLFLSVILFAACSEDDQVTTTEEYLGTYYAIDDSLYITNIGLTTDSIVFTIVNKSTYSILHYDVNSSDSKQFCNTTGKIEGFGSNRVAFFPNDPSGSNCDQLRIARGTFEADFVSYGDTIYLSQSGAIDSLPKSLYRFKLLK